MSERFERTVFGHKFGSHFKQPRGVSFFLRKHRIPGIILKEARRRKQTIYGTHAMNQQLPLCLRRSTEDFDIYVRNPRRVSNKMQARLDKEISRGDEFFATPAKHRGTHRVVHIGLDMKRRTADDIIIADYSRLPKGLKIVKQKGLRWESLSSIEKGKRRILRDPKSKYRHRKDRGDLHRILAYKKLRKLLS